MEQANNIEKYLKIIDNYKNKSEVYYRGQLEKYKTMPPSVSRDLGYLVNESRIYHEAISLCSIEFDGLNSSLEKLSKLQHYGVPTRLVDLTIDPLIALYFAVENVDDPSPANVYLYNVNGYLADSKEVRILSILPTISKRTIENIRLEYKKQFDDHIDHITDKNILSIVNSPAILSFSERLQKSNPRLFSQKGTFLICGNKVNDNTITDTLISLEVFLPAIIIRIPFEYKKTVKNELDYKHNINVTTIYPELPSVAQYIKNKYREENISMNKKYTVIKEKNISTGAARRISVIIVLNEPLSIEEIKNVSIEIMQHYQKTQDVVWLYVAKTGDDYITSNWILRGQWISPKLNPLFRPIPLKKEEDGFYWDYNDSYSINADFYNKYFFEDDIVLFKEYIKMWEQFRLCYSKINDIFINAEQIFSTTIIDTESNKVRNIYMQINNFGHSHNKNFDDFLAKIINTICSVDNICLDLKEFQSNNKIANYSISRQLKDVSVQIEQINQEFQMWKTELGIESY